MPRVARSNFRTSFFHVITQGINRENVFHKNEYIEIYLNLLKKYEKDYDISILAYCIMNNHAHLLIYSPKIKNMGKYMHRVNGIYGQYYNKNENRVGIVFRNRYVSEPIYNEAYLAQCINYIHMNPVKAKMVKRSEDYKYSSSKAYRDNTGVAKKSILIEVYGKNFTEWLNNYEVENAFIDIDINREELMEEGIKKFETIKNQKLNEVLRSEEKIKEMVKFLKENYKIKYTEMMKKFGITQGKMNTLKK